PTNKIGLLLLHLSKISSVFKSFVFVRFCLLLSGSYGSCRVSITCFQGSVPCF
ncbi:unnamed protein product, partial [Brassica rapa]